jgi:predicted ester cyclase
MSEDNKRIVCRFVEEYQSGGDVSVAQDLLAADGDKVWTRKTFHGTHGAEFMGAPASGRTVTFDVIDVVRVRDAKMVEHWNVVDALTLMQQLGAAPVPS